LFVGKRYDERESELQPHEDRECELIIDAFGYSRDALALRVESITYLDSDDGDIQKTLPSFPNRQQHVTMALRVGVKPKDSVQTLLGYGTIVEFENKIKLNGIVKRIIA